MEEGGFDWDSENIGHIKKHRVLPAEAEQVFINDPLSPSEGNPQSINGEVRWILYGETDQGRYLVVIYTERGPEPLTRVVTAYPMKPRERKDYLLWRNQLSETEYDESVQAYGTNPWDEDAN